MSFSCDTLLRALLSAILKFLVANAFHVVSATFGDAVATDDMSVTCRFMLGGHVGIFPMLGHFFRDSVADMLLSETSCVHVGAPYLLCDCGRDEGATVVGDGCSISGDNGGDNCSQ